MLKRGPGVDLIYIYIKMSYQYMYSDYAYIKVRRSRNRLIFIRRRFYIESTPRVAISTSQNAVSQEYKV